MQDNYSVIHEELEGEKDYSPKTVLTEVGDYLDRRTADLLDDPDVNVTGYLDAAFHDIGEPRFNPNFSYEPSGFIDEVEVDQINGVFQVHANGEMNQYWIPYIENETLCVFTNHFSSGSDPLEGVRFSIGRDLNETPEIPTNPRLSHDLAWIYETIEKNLADEWGIPLFGKEVSAQEAEFQVDTSMIKENLLALQEENPELFKQATDKIERIAVNPIAQSEKIIQGERIYKINREYRLTGNVVDPQQNKVKLRRFGHRTDIYSEGVEH